MSTINQFKSNYFFGLCCLQAFVMPYSQVISGIITALLILVAIFTAKKRILSNIQNPLLWLFISIYLLYTIGLLYTENYTQGLHHLEQRLSLLIFPFAFVLTKKLKEKEIMTILNFFIAGITLACTISLIMAFYRYTFDEHIYKQNSFFFYYRDLTYPFVLDPVYFSIYVSFAALLIVNFLIENWQSTVSSQRSKLLTLVLFLTCFNVMLSARMSLLAFFIILTFMFFIKVDLKAKKKITIAGLVIAVIFIFVLNNEFTIRRISKFNKLSYEIDNPDFKAWNGITTRIVIWKSSWYVIQKNLLLGVGRGDSKDEMLSVYEQKKFNYGLDNKYNIHNQYLQTFVASGIFGFFLLVISLGIPLRKSILVRNWPYTILLIIIIIGFVSESILSRYKGIVFYSFFNSLFGFYTFKK